MRKVHKNIGTFESNRMIYQLGDFIWIYIKALCAPNKVFTPTEVDGNDKGVTCKRCLKIMRRK